MDAGEVRKPGKEGRRASEQRESIAPYGGIVGHHQHAVEEGVDLGAQRSQTLERLAIAPGRDVGVDVGREGRDRAVHRVLGVFLEERRVDGRGQIGRVGLAHQVGDALEAGGERGELGAGTEGAQRLGAGEHARDVGEARVEHGLGRVGGVTASVGLAVDQP